MSWTAIVLLLTGIHAFAQTCGPSATKVWIANVQFERTPGLTTDLEKEITRELQTHITDACQLSGEMPERVLDFLQQQGYFKALVQDPTWKQIGGTDTARKLRVLLAIDLGEKYRLDHITFREQTVFDSQQLRAAIPISDGDVFNVERLRAGLKALRELYCSQGYIYSTPVPNTEIDDEHHVIKVVFTLDEGRQYRVGQLILNGIEPLPGAGRKLLDAWEPHVGEVYDCAFVEQFLKMANQVVGEAIENAKLHNNDDTDTLDMELEFPDPD